MHRQVAQLRIVFEPVEHRPAVAVLQQQVESDGARPEPARGADGLLRRALDDDLEAFLAREVRDHGGEAAIVLDHQQDAVARHQVGAIVVSDVVGIVADCNLARRRD